MRLNPKTCVFAVVSGKFLGVVVTMRGIEASLEHLKSFINMLKPRTKRDIQRLTGHIAALNRFVPCSSGKCRPFFKLLKKKTPFVWDNECLAGFD